MSGQTLLLDGDGSQEVSRLAIELSRASFAKQQEESLLTEESRSQKPITKNSDGTKKDEVSSKVVKGRKLTTKV
jgi:hypothetical protein